MRVFLFCQHLYAPALLAKKIYTNFSLLLLRAAQNSFNWPRSPSLLMDDMLPVFCDEIDFPEVNLDGNRKLDEDLSHVWDVNDFLEYHC
ncbi:hypothetical protein RND71_042549 [Anisodus tanguticus]|uniref:Uncharacterized protein n=1 Tax=Anisodus tanguticus TaxID=243964 RepID=A0AAE1UP85_9SOLA|nr:hypothetical protein RND71_042549 [Anisodus tanguticus]